MASEMIERVARALDPDIWAIDGPVPTRADVTDFHARRQRSVQLARAAIEAMREPTPQMVAAVAPLALTAADLDCYDIAAKAVALLPQNQHPDLPDVLATMVQDHRAMIDAALSEQEG